MAHFGVVLHGLGTCRHPKVLPALVYIGAFDLWCFSYVRHILQPFSLFESFLTSASCWQVLNVSGYLGGVGQRPVLMVVVVVVVVVLFLLRRLLLLCRF